MKTITFKKNLWGGITAVIIGGLLWIILPYCIVSKMQHTTNSIGPEYLPRLILMVLVVSGVGLIVKSVLFKKDEEVTISVHDELYAILYMISFITYVFLLPFLGFVLSSIVFSAASLFLMHDKCLKHYLYACALVALIFVGFKFGLGVNLPAIFF